MVADKENWASNILVRNEDEDQDISYSHAAQEVFSSFFCRHSGNRTDPEKKDQDEMQMRLAKRPSQLMEVEDSNRPLDAPLPKPSFQPRPQYMTCGYCLKLGTYNTTARKVMNYVICGSKDQLKSDCPFKEAENIALIRLTHPESPLWGNLRPTGRITSLHPQHQA